MDILEAAPEHLQLDLLPPLEKVLFRSHRITKYLEAKLGLRFLDFLAHMWRIEAARPVLHAVWLFVKHSWQWESACRDEEQVDFFHSAVDRLVAGNVFSLIRDELLAPSASGTGLTDEYKKLILLLYSHSTEGLSGEMEQVIAEMGDDAVNLGPIAAQVYLDVTGHNPLNENLYIQGIWWFFQGGSTQNRWGLMGFGILLNFSKKLNARGVYFGKYGILYLFVQACAYSNLDLILFVMRIHCMWFVCRDGGNTVEVCRRIALHELVC